MFRRINNKTICSQLTPKHLRYLCHSQRSLSFNSLYNSTPLTASSFISPTRLFSATMTINNSTQHNVSTAEELSKLQNPALFGISSHEQLLQQSGPKAAFFKVLDPATEQEIGALPEMGAEETRAAIDRASEAFKSWSKLGTRERKQKLLAWFDLLNQHKDDLARMITIEAGKSLAEAGGEVVYGSSFIEWFAQEAIRADGDTMPILTTNQRILTIRQPVGVVGIVTPWNFPNAMITRKVGAALAAGCTVVIKPAAETPYSAIAMKNLAVQAGIPQDAINIVTTHANVAEVGLELSTNPKIKKISFTGSTAIGKLLLKQASSTVKKASMELGGNAPFIVFDDANINDAVNGLMIAKFRNSGQTCVCANRVFVHSSIYDEFVGKAIEKMKSTLVLGHGTSPNTNMGPLISRRAVDRMSTIIEDAVSKGATEIKILDLPQELNTGYFYPPTVLSNVTTDMIAAKDEIFGPICGIIKFESEEHLFSMVNQVSVGLAGYFYSNNISRIFRVAEGIETGMIGVNTGIISSEVLPFGGVKESGLGREGSKYGLEEYLTLKSIVINI